jgi:hypothetical protein
MRRSRSYDRIGPERFFLSTDEAVRQAEAWIGRRPRPGEVDLAGNPGHRDVAGVGELGELQREHRLE